MMDNPVLKALMDRRSVRAYTREPVSQEMLDAVLTCAINAPSAMNLQPWHLTVVKNRAWLDEVNLAIREAVLEGKPGTTFAPDDDFFYHAPLAVFVSSKDGGGGTDCGMLTENFLIAAQALGLGTCVVGMAMFAMRGRQSKRFMDDLHMPEGHVPHYAIILGHPAETPEAKPRDGAKISYM